MLENIFNIKIKTANRKLSRDPICLISYVTSLADIACVGGERQNANLHICVNAGQFVLRHVSLLAVMGPVDSPLTYRALILIEHERMAHDPHRLHVLHKK
eukprot:767044-Hanusia_phi.AAC.2